MVHSVVHLLDEAILRGPVQFGWMYPVERQLCTLKGLVRNAARHEGSIAEGYVAKEALTYCSRYMDNVETSCNRDNDEVSVDIDVACFKHGVTGVGRTRSVTLGTAESKAIHWYTLNNSEEVVEYLG